MAAITVSTTSRAWYEGSTAIYWTARCAFDTGTALYIVTQDSSATPKVRVRKADSRTAPTTFTEQDSANNKTASQTGSWTAWFAGGDIHVVALDAGAVRFTHYVFDPGTDTWATGNGQVSAGATSNKGIRFGVRSDGDVIVIGINSGDDADIGRWNWEGASWSGSATAILGITSAEASTILDGIMDGSDFFSSIYQEAGLDRAAYRSYSSANVSGTATDVGALIGADHTAHSAGAVYTPYDDSGTDKVIAAYIDSDGTLRESVLTLESASAGGNVAATVAIESTAANVGTRTPITTCRFDGTDYAMWYDDASSGTIYYATKSGGTWGGRTAWKTGVSRPVQLLPVGTDGLLAVYHSAATTVVVDWVVAPVVNASVTITADSLAVSGKTVTTSAGAAATVSPDALTITGQPVTASAEQGASATVTADSLTISGKAITVRADTAATITSDALTIAGNAVTVSAGAAATIDADVLVIVGRTLAAHANDVPIVNVVTFVAADQARSFAAGTFQGAYAAGDVGDGYASPAHDLAYAAADRGAPYDGSS